MADTVSVEAQGGIDAMNVAPRLVEIQVRVSQIGKVLPSLRRGFGKVESPDHARGRLDNARPSGKMVVDQTPCSGLTEVLEGLRISGYIPVDATVEIRDHKDGWGTYCIQRFVFCALPYYRADDISPGFIEASPKIMKELGLLLENTRGRVRVFDNPYFDPESKEAVRGQRALLVNYDQMETLVENGVPRMVWKIKGGKNVEGNEKVPLAAEIEFVFDGQEIRAV